MPPTELIAFRVCDATADCSMSKADTESMMEVSTVNREQWTVLCCVVLLCLAPHGPELIME
jgi:hypothetical protein